MSDLDPSTDIDAVTTEFEQGIVTTSSDNPEAGSAGEQDPTPQPLPSVPQLTQFTLPKLDEASKRQHPVDFLRDVELNVDVELGRTRLELDEVRRIQSGTVVALDRRTSEPVDVVVNGQLLARGEVIVLDGKLCVRVSEIIGEEAA